MNNAVGYSWVMCFSDGLADLFSVSYTNERYLYRGKFNIVENGPNKTF